MLKPQNKTELESFKVKLPQDQIENLKAYAAAIHSDANYVVSMALKKLFSDKEFLQWKRDHVPQPEKRTRTSHSPTASGPKEGQAA